MDATTPVRLPVGMTEFKEWADKIIDLAGPIADRDSMEYVLASTILHLGDEKDPVTGVTKRRAAAPLQEFVDILWRSAANQVASQVFQDITQAKKQREEQLKQQAEATAENTVASDGNNAPPQN